MTPLLCVSFLLLLPSLVRRSVTARLVVPFTGALLLGCVSNYHDSYTAGHPDWFSTFPDADAGLHETLAGLYVPSEYRHRRSISQLAVVRLTDASVKELSSEEIAVVLDAAPGGDSYGIVATVDCRSEIDKRMYAGQKVEWLLLEEGRLSAWDVHAFGSRCVVGNDFVPAGGSGVSLEQQLVGFRDANFPVSMAHTAEYYVKGLKYIERERLVAAEAMLERGDATMSVSSGSGTRFARPSEAVDTVDSADEARARADLVYGIRMLRAGQPSGE
jgi:hypothetical protein